MDPISLAITAFFILVAALPTAGILTAGVAGAGSLGANLVENRRLGRIMAETEREFVLAASLPRDVFETLVANVAQEVLGEDAPAVFAKWLPCPIGGKTYAATEGQIRLLGQYLDQKDEAKVKAVMGVIVVQTMSLAADLQDAQSA